MRHVVLVGAGHAHLEVLRRFARRPALGVRLTLVTPARYTLYSAMLPGVVAGHYGAGQAQIDAAALAEAAGATLVLAAACGLDLGGRRVLCAAAAAAIPFDVLSLNAGSHPNTGGVPGAAHAIAVKPVGGFLARFAGMLDRVQSGASRHVAIVGGGAAGVELALAVAHRLGAGVQTTLIAAGADILAGLPATVAIRLHRALAGYGVAVQMGRRVSTIEPGAVLLDDGGRLPADEVLWAAEAAPLPWLAGCGLPRDPRGFLQVDATLQAAQGVFAAGDMITFGPKAIARSGVLAVRAGPVLAANLRAAATGRPLRPFQPPAATLAIVTAGRRSAVATRGGLVAEGRLIWWWKDRIDRRFVARYARRRGFRDASETS